jgi:hypothetical protein
VDPLPVDPNSPVLTGHPVKAESGDRSVTTDDGKKVPLITVGPGAGSELDGRVFTTNHSTHGNNVRGDNDIMRGVPAAFVNVMDKDGFSEQFFRDAYEKPLSLDALKAAGLTENMSPSQVSNFRSGEFGNGLQGAIKSAEAQGKILYITGNFDLHTVGTVDGAFIVGGNASFDGSNVLTINGFMYVEGNFTHQSGSIVNGCVAVQGTLATQNTIFAAGNSSDDDPSKYSVGETTIPDPKTDTFVTFTNTEISLLAVQGEDLLTSTIEQIKASLSWNLGEIPPVSQFFDIALDEAGKVTIKPISQGEGDDHRDVSKWPADWDGKLTFTYEVGNGEDVRPVEVLVQYQFAPDWTGDLVTDNTWHGTDNNDIILMGGVGGMVFGNDGNDIFSWNIDDFNQANNVKIMDFHLGSDHLMLNLSGASESIANLFTDMDHRTENLQALLDKNLLSLNVTGNVVELEVHGKQEHHIKINVVDAGGYDIATMDHATLLNSLLVEYSNG